MTKTKRHFSSFSVDCSLPGRTAKNQKGMLSFSLQSPRLAVSLLRQASISKHDMHTHTHPQTCTDVLCVHATLMHTAPCNLLSPNYSRLEPMLLSLILSARGLWGNSDISVWCLAYVSRALPGPIKLIFNVCPTLDGPSQGWHSSRGDVIGVWRRPHCALGCSQLDLWESITDVLPSHNWLKHLQWTKPATQYRDRPSTNI